MLIPMTAPLGRPGRSEFGVFEDTEVTTGWVVDPPGVADAFVIEVLAERDEADVVVADVAWPVLE